MIIFLLFVFLIYILGVVASLTVIFYTEKKLQLGDLVEAILYSLLSWGLIIVMWDDVKEILNKVTIFDKDGKEKDQ